MSPSNNFIKNMVNLTWNVNVNGDRVNPRPTNPDLYIAGLKFQYSCQAAPHGSEFSHHMYLEFIDDALEDFDHHWRLTVVWKNPSGVTAQQTFSESSRRALFYGFTLAHDNVPDEWALLSAEVHPHRKVHVDAARAAQQGNNYRIELTKNGSHVFVNRKLLGQNSSYFRQQLSLLNNAEILHLDDVEEAEFLDYIYCVHPPVLVPTLARIGRVMKLAKRFENQALCSAGERFLHTFSTDDSTEKRDHLIQLGRHGMQKDFDRALRRMKQTDFKGLDVTLLEEFQAKNMRLLLQRITVPQRYVFVRLFCGISRAFASLHSLLTNTFSTTANDKIDFASFLENSDHDCTIIVEGHESKPIKIQKDILAMNSEYFKTLFFGDFKEANSSTVTLKDIDYDKFLQYLVCVHPPSVPLTMDRVSSVLSMADQFRNELLLKHCSDFLQFKMSKTEAEKLETLYLAEQFDLKTLFTSTVEQLNEDVENVNIDIVTGFRPENLRKFIDYCLKRL